MKDWNRRPLPSSRDADAGVAHGESQLDRVLVHRLRVHRQHDLARLGELDRIGEEVDEDLPQPRHVAPDGARDIALEQVGGVEVLLDRARWSARSSADSTQSRRSNGCDSMSIRPASIFEKSRMSLMIVSSASPRVADGRRRSRAARRSSGVSSSRPLMPITAFIGVRISWLIVARNALFASLAASAAARACLRFLEQPRVLDRDHRLVGEGLRERTSWSSKRPVEARKMVMQPMALPSRSSGTNRHDW